MSRIPAAETRPTAGTGLSTVPVEQQLQPDPHVESTPLPVAITKKLRRAVDVLLALTEGDLRVRYGRGRWRLVKWLLDPFALVGIYLLLLTFVLDRGGAAYGLSVACAVVPFQLVMMAVSNALLAVHLRGAILLNMAFDRLLIPLSSALTEAVAFAASFTLFPLLMAAYGVEPTAALLWLPLVVVVNLVFGVACTYPASLFGLWYPDLRPFAVSFVRALYFLAPGLVPLAEIPGRTGDLVRLNPLTGLFEAYRAVFLFGRAPEAWQLLYPAAVAVVLLAVFVPLYAREQRHFAKVV